MVDLVDYAALADIRHALRAFAMFSERRAADHGLTAQQHQALLAIRGAPDAAVTVGYVAERLIIKPHSATGLVDRLESLGLITRSPSAADGRRAVLTLTDKARSLLERLSTTHQEELRRLRPLLTALLAQLD